MLFPYTNKGVRQYVIIGKLEHELLRRNIMIGDELGIFLTMLFGKLEGNYHYIWFQGRTGRIGGMVDKVTYSNGRGGLYSL